MKRALKMTTDISTLKVGHLYLVHMMLWSKKHNKYVDRYNPLWYVSDKEELCFEELNGTYGYALTDVIEWTEIPTEVEA